MPNRKVAAAKEGKAKAHNKKPAAKQKHNLYLNHWNHLTQTNQNQVKHNNILLS